MINLEKNLYMVTYIATDINGKTAIISAYTASEGGRGSRYWSEC